MSNDVKHNIKVVKRKPRTPSLRFQSYLYNTLVSKKNNPESSLIGKRSKNQAGRNAYGRITVRHRGGGVKRKYRFIDFSRQGEVVHGVVTSIEYDPNRNVPIALITYINGKKKYILLPETLEIGSKVEAGENVAASIGNALPLSKIPVGFSVHNIQVRPGSTNTLVRSAGGVAQVVSKEKEHASVKLPSGEVRLLPLESWATVGTLSNAAFKNIQIGKAGRNRWLGKRPSVRGMAMNPVDHPHGGGEGRSKSGKHPQTPWGKSCKGMKTRKHKNRFILREKRKK
jgi:large subunit ribosomal protein L2